jgi:hypothetical protein
MLKTPYLVALAGAAMIATSLFMTEPSANEPARGPYQIEAQANTGNIWLVDTRSGAVRMCLPPRDASAGKPECGPWQSGGR